MKNQNKPQEEKKNRDANRDPLTGSPGSHPVGTGAGAAAGGIAGAGAGAAIGAATGTATGGPIGTGIGAVAGAIAGAAGGHALAESINPTEEEAYWREQHTREPYYRSDYKWEDYHKAYRAGYEGFRRFGRSHHRFEDAEADLRRDYESRQAGSMLRWDEARHAARAAWDRVHSRSHERHLDQLIGYDVFDVNDSKVGTLKCIWADENGEPEFVGVNTGWLFGKTHVVPAQSVQIGERSQRIRLPYTEQKIKEAPAYDADAELTAQTESEVWNYYGASPAQQRPKRTAEPGRERREAEEHAEMQLSEETLKIGKREVEAGGVRLRKIIRTEVVNQPVELKREEVIIERTPVSEAGMAAEQGAFREEEVYIPLRREEAVVQKGQRVREVVRARKSSQSDRQEVTEKVRKEDVEIENTGEAREARPGGEKRRRTPAEEIAERGNVPRSRRNP